MVYLNENGMKATEKDQWFSVMGYLFVLANESSLVL
jgi:hypothetical protein